MYFCKINSNLTGTYVSLENDSVRLEANEYIVSMRVYASVTANSAGWHKFCTLPEQYRPYGFNVYFPCCDNNASLYSDSRVIQAKLESNGDLSFYAFSDRFTFTATGSICYVIR